MKHYSELLALLNRQSPRDHGSSLLTFEAEVLRRYREAEGPWSLHKSDVTFYHWPDEAPEKLVALPYSQSKSYVSVALKNLASLPRSEQEHWKKFQIS